MGAWGVGSFQNDAALDWVWELESDSDGSVLQRAFASFPDDDGGSIAIAAGEVVAAAFGSPLQELPGEVTAWLAKTDGVGDDLRRTAIETVRLVRDGSELRSLWDEVRPDAWLAAVDDLLARLSTPALTTSPHPSPKPRRREVKVGVVLEARVSDGYRYLQWVGPGHHVNLVRVFEGRYDHQLDEGELAHLVDTGESYKVEAVVESIAAEESISPRGVFNVSERAAEIPPMRVLVSPNDENPMGWFITLPDGTWMWGRDYASAFPHVDQTALPLSNIPLGDTFTKILEDGWTPSRAIDQRDPFRYLG